MAHDAGGAIMPADGETGPVVSFGVADLDRALGRVRQYSHSCLGLIGVVRFSDLSAVAEHAWLGSPPSL
jgi:hypothetical protein